MRRFYIPLMGLILFLPVVGRLALHDFDATFFIVADKTFVVDPGRLPFPITLVDGAGYDGQFFFKTALDLSGNGYGDAIQYDAPSYRRQRILYPLLAWLIAFGQPVLIPLAMIAINCIVLLGLWMLFHSVCIKNNLSPIYSALPLMYSGLHMAVGRDLVEPLEMLLVLGAFLAASLKSPAFFSFLSLLAFFTKETTIIYLLPAAGYLTIERASGKLPKFISFAFMMGLPYILYLFWKLHLNSYYGETALVQGVHDFSLPFVGLVSGFTSYFSQQSLTNTTALIVASLQFAWLIWLIIITIPYIRKAAAQFFKEHFAQLAWTLWLILSLFFSSSIFRDDWGFVRLFTVFSGLSFLILFSNGRQPGKRFVLFTVFLYAVMTLRLCLRP